MDSVPLLFIDNVCHQLKFQAFDQVKQLSGAWSTIGSVHKEKRREFEFSCTLEGQNVGYRCACAPNWSSLKVNDLNLTYDRITSVASNWTDERKIKTSLDEFQRNVLPTVTFLLMNCHFIYVDRETGQNRLFFNSFKNSAGFFSIYGHQQSQEARDFAAQQVQYGNVEKLYVRDGDVSPESEQLAVTLELFVRSTRFYILDAHRLLQNDLTLVEVFLERALANVLKCGAAIWLRNLTFSKMQLDVLHPEHRIDTEKLAWRIPNSNLRIEDASSIWNSVVKLQVVVPRRSELQLTIRARFHPSSSIITKEPRSPQLLLGSSGRLSDG